MSFKRLGKNTYIQIGDRWYGIHHIIYIKFTKASIISSGRVELTFEHNRHYFSAETDEYKFFEKHFNNNSDVNTITETTVPETVKDNTSSDKGIKKSTNIPSYSSSVKNRQ